jgi:hypothetical protein
MAKFAVVDHVTHNILGEYPTKSQAEDLRARLVHADPRADEGLEIHVVEDAQAEAVAEVVLIERERV